MEICALAEGLVRRTLPSKLLEAGSALEEGPKKASEAVPDGCELPMSES